MSETPVPSTGHPSPPPAARTPVALGRSLWGHAWHKLFRDRAAMICLAVILLYGLVAAGVAVYEVIARHSRGKYPTYSQMANYDPERTNLSPLDFWKSQDKPGLKPGQKSRQKSWTEVLGTDWAGRSVLIETIFGAKVSMSVGLIANLISIPLGILLGAVAGYFGGWIDDVIVWLYSTLMSIPGIILLFAIKFVFTGRTVLGMDLAGIEGVYLALGFTGWIGTCRLIRAEVMKIRELEYCLAARAIGRSGWGILLRHVTPNVLHIGIINFSLGFVGAVSAEVMLSYFGLGVSVGTPSWGVMINGARMDLLAHRWWELTSAVGAMFFLVLALNIFGDRLRDALDPRLKNV